MRKTLKVIFTSNYWSLFKNNCFEICFEKKTKESVVGTFKNISTVGAHYWYTKGAFARLCQQFLKKLKLYKKLRLETVHYMFPSKFICDHLQISSTYKSIFTTAISHWTTTKSITGVTSFGNAPCSIKCPYFNTIILSTLKNCNWLKKVCAYSAIDHVLLSFGIFF